VGLWSAQQHAEAAGRIRQRGREYRTLACDSRVAAAAEEAKMRAMRTDYLFGT
jgi:hypothetical protein